MSTPENRAYLSGLLAADGKALRRGGVSILQKGRNVPVLSQLSAAFEGQCNVWSNGEVYFPRRFVDPSVRDAVPHLTPDLERHYARGLIDGDGCLILRRGRLEAVKYVFNPNHDQPFVDFWLAFTRQLGLDAKITFTPATNGRTVPLGYASVYRGAKSLAETLYQDCTLAIPWKAERALVNP
jgi:hypothetical protein